MTFDCHWKSIEGCALVKRLILWNGYNVPFVSDLRQVGGFFPRTPVSSTNKTGHHDTTEILLIKALSTKTITTTTAPSVVRMLKCLYKHEIK
jgi:hypothetical protein